jgi:hypothetical protein
LVPFFPWVIMLVIHGLSSCQAVGREGMMSHQTHLAHAGAKRMHPLDLTDLTSLFCSPAASHGNRRECGNKPANTGYDPVSFEYVEAINPRSSGNASTIKDQNSEDVEATNLKPPRLHTKKEAPSTSLKNPRSLPSMTRISRMSKSSILRAPGLPTKMEGLLEQKPLATQ